MCLAFVWLVGFTPLAAEGTGSIAQGFQTDEKEAVTGALMSLKDGSPKNVELSTVENADQLVGVVGTNTLLEVSSGEREVQVVTSGLTHALVSDINGDIKTGDKITASPIEGIGMKADSSVQVVGIAQADLSSVKVNARSLKDKDGRQQQVRVGLIPVQVNVTFYAAPDDRASILPAFLQDFANSIAGREVSPLRVIISTIMMLAAFISIAVLLYASVNSSIISIGRNPLSEGAVRKSLLQVALTTFGILLLTLITVYLILTT